MNVTFQKTERTDMSHWERILLFIIITYINILFTYFNAKKTPLYIRANTVHHAVYLWCQLLAVLELRRSHKASRSAPSSLKKVRWKELKVKNWFFFFFLCNLATSRSFSSFSVYDESFPPFGMCVGDTASVPAAHEALSIVMCLMVHPSLFTVYIASFDQIHCLLRQRAQEEVHSKELKVKLLTDSVNSFIAKAPPTAHDALRSELDVLKVNYQRLCSRLDGKCKTLEVFFFFLLTL